MAKPGAVAGAVTGVIVPAAVPVPDGWYERAAMVQKGKKRSR